MIRFEWNYRNSTITQDMVLSAVKAHRFRTTVDWHERQQLLKVAFPVDIRATEATYDIQFETSNGQHTGTPAGIGRGLRL